MMKGLSQNKTKVGLKGDHVLGLYHRRDCQNKTKVGLKEYTILARLFTALMSE